jgi:hypothetical protein
MARQLVCVTRIYIPKSITKSFIFRSRYPSCIPKTHPPLSGKMPRAQLVMHPNARRALRIQSKARTARRAAKVKPVNFKINLSRATIQQLSTALAAVVFCHAPPGQIERTSNVNDIVVHDSAKAAHSCFLSLTMFRALINFTALCSHFTKKYTKVV